MDRLSISSNDPGSSDPQDDTRVIQLPSESSVAQGSASGRTSENPILVVDDDDGIRRLFATTLQRAGFTTAEAANGNQAVELISSRSFAAVLLDNHMPGMDGLELIRKLRGEDETATLPIILVTGASEVAERVQGLQAGASDYLTKPVELDELVARVRSQLRGQAAWMHKVEGHLRERAAIARALAQIRPADTPEATASIVCFELSLLHQLSSVAMYAFGQGEIVMPIGRYGPPVLGEVVGEGLDTIASRYLLERAALGPWTERSESLRRTIMSEGVKPASTLAFAPMVYESQLLGLLALAAEPSDPTSPASFVTHALSAAIDFASVTAGLLAPALTERGKDEARSSLLDNVIINNEFFPVFQPIVDIGSQEIVGYETLTRFHDGIRPDLRFIEATLVGRGVDLEMATLRRALDAASDLPDDAFLSVNVSPALVMEEGALQSLLRDSKREIVLELTEHERVDDYVELRRALDEIGPEVKLSVDDAGSGFASLRHVLSLQPHFVKLDASLVHNIHMDPARQALVAGIEYFATETSARLIAEGIEQQDELDTLNRLDVELGQGYLLGRPSPLTPA
jgi:EAL domain-containing protein (putative c-di-GMP-specific phosphodiesterase class I)/DNA-binding response OmpR family regulator